MHYEIVNSGSDGNCVIINDILAIDMGVSYKKLSPYVPKLQIVFLTHRHGDHFNTSTIVRLAKERPMIRFACCEWMAHELSRIGISEKRIDILEIGKKYDYEKFQIVPIKLYHDVPQCGYRVFMNDEKLIYCTDTGTLEGIKAINYDYYLIEGNYEDEEELKSYAENDIYYHRVKATHLSKEYARNWLLDNMGLNSVYEWMHEHKERISKNDE